MNRKDPFRFVLMLGGLILLVTMGHSAIMGG